MCLEFAISARQLCNNRMPGYPRFGYVSFGTLPRFAPKTFRKTVKKKLLDVRTLHLLTSDAGKFHGIRLLLLELLGLKRVIQPILPLSSTAPSAVVGFAWSCPLGRSARSRGYAGPEARRAACGGPTIRTTDAMNAVTVGTTPTTVLASEEDAGDPGRTCFGFSQL